MWISIVSEAFESTIIVKACRKLSLLRLMKSVLVKLPLFEHLLINIWNVFHCRIISWFPAFRLFADSPSAPSALDLPCQIINQNFVGVLFFFREQYELLKEFPKFNDIWESVLCFVCWLKEVRLMFVPRLPRSLRIFLFVYLICINCIVTEFKCWQGICD